MPLVQCPGNRRWIQIVYDAWLLMQPGVSMLDARDAYLAADQLRFGGANQAELWHAFAFRGFGKGASSASSDDDQPTPGFVSPREGFETLTLKAESSVSGLPAVHASFFVGSYEARVTPVADTDPTTALGAKVKLVSGRTTSSPRLRATAPSASRWSPRPERRA